MHDDYKLHRVLDGKKTLALMCIDLITGPETRKVRKEDVN